MLPPTSSAPRRARGAVRRRGGGGRPRRRRAPSPGGETPAAWATHRSTMDRLESPSGRALRRRRQRGPGALGSPSPSKIPIAVVNGKVGVGGAEKGRRSGADPETFETPACTIAVCVESPPHGGQERKRKPLLMRTTLSGGQGQTSRQSRETHGAPRSRPAARPAGTRPRRGGRRRRREPDLRRADALGRRDPYPKPAGAEEDPLAHSRRHPTSHALVETTVGVLPPRPSRPDHERVAPVSGRGVRGGEQRERERGGGGHRWTYCARPSASRPTSWTISLMHEQEGPAGPPTRTRRTARPRVRSEGPRGAAPVRLGGQLRAGRGGRRRPRGRRAVEVAVTARYWTPSRADTPPPAQDVHLIPQATIGAELSRVPREPQFSGPWRSRPAENRSRGAPYPLEIVIARQNAAVVPPVVAVSPPRVERRPDDGGLALAASAAAVISPGKTRAAAGEDDTVPRPPDSPRRRHRPP
ncbi:hypothetical protein THAOC_10547 [Thalassiosira oceanica]|uniref:Uncharacterized protein n=1 Tax=Thalassiosira oceanica TaxID=159749 RepID=K0TCS3_THAOC|nr:hypothetical protein THAOC_10547 [Thalassiosira oceanica]|eukprot:EJK68287.1 hypothetical protein THAOC_10547 [Thalassiosira oceanica]